MIDVHHIEQISQDCSLTEFVGTTVLDTIGLCLLYTSDAADEEDSVDLGGRRIIKKKKKTEKYEEDDND